MTTAASHLSRRSFFSTLGGGIYGAALTSLLNKDLYSQERPRPHFEPWAKAVIHLFMNGGPSQMDLFDPKTELTKRHGQPYFNRIAGEVENPTAAGALMRSPFRFKQHGQSGMWVSELMPFLGGCVDDIALIRSLYTTNLTHEPALFKAHSGRELPGLPTLGAWATYALGSENQNLPSYVVLDDPKGLPINGIQNWQSGFLPPQYQGTRFRSKGAPVLNLHPDFQQPPEIQELEQDLISRLDRMHQSRRPQQPNLEARIASYQLAARMQLHAGAALDLSRETKSTLRSYGIGEKETDSYGRRCLIARRLVERGVRFVQIFINGQIWDNHTNIGSELPKCCRSTDQPVAALLSDLKQRGLLEQTLVLWGGEFGRLPIAQLPSDKDEKKAGRDHNKNAMVAWMAGGGIQGGLTYGSTDELGLAAIEKKVCIGDLHATLLHLLGLHHEELFFERNGLKEKLTGVEKARVVKELLRSDSGIKRG